MLKTVYDFTMLFVVGAVKVSLFVFLFCFGMLFFMKSKDFAISDKPAHAGLLTNPGNTENIKNALNHEPAAGVPAVPDIEDMTPEEAEVFLFVLRFSEGMSTMNARKLAKIPTAMSSISGLLHRPSRGGGRPMVAKPGERGRWTGRSGSGLPCTSWSRRGEAIRPKVAGRDGTGCRARRPRR